MAAIAADLVDGQLGGGLDQRRQGHGSPPAQGRGAGTAEQDFLDLDGNALLAIAIPDDGIGPWPARLTSGVRIFAHAAGVQGGRPPWLTSGRACLCARRGGSRGSPPLADIWACVSLRTPRGFKGVAPRLTSGRARVFAHAARVQGVAPLG